MILHAGPSFPELSTWENVGVNQVLNPICVADLPVVTTSGDHHAVDGNKRHRDIPRDLGIEDESATPTNNSEAEVLI